jgi:flavin-dependent dehydrogenase
VAARPAWRRRPLTGTERVEVAIVGGGLAGAAVAARLAPAGREVVVLERARAWRWRASGVFASPAAMTALRRLGVDEAAMERVARSIPAMRVETARGTAFRLTYGAEAGGATAVGFDRSELDPTLLQLAADRGADVRRGIRVESIDLSTGLIETRTPDGTTKTIECDLIVGADGIRSLVARSAGVARPARLPPRIGLTYHLADPDDRSRDARIRVLPDGYVGIAPVPGGRVNIGIVLGPSWKARLAKEGAEAVTRSIVRAVPAADDPGAWREGRLCDRIEGASPLGHRVTRRAGLGERAGRGWLLVGDAAGFLDPFTGEGLHRALVSAELAVRAIGRPGPVPDLGAYEAAMDRRFFGKDVVSALVQTFLARPALFEYAARRLASRARVRATMGLVMGDLVPASRGLDPRYLASLLAP